MRRMLMSSVMLSGILVVASGATSRAGAGGATHGFTKPMTAKISPQAARVRALRKVHGAKVESEELEREHGRLVYSFDLMVPHKSGIRELQVDAMTGKIVSVKHETPASERKERAKERRESTHANTSR